MKREWVGPASLALLTCIGQLKEHPLLRWVPVDLTLLVAAFVVLMIIRARMQLGPTTGRVLIMWALWGTFVPAIALSSFDAYSTTKIATLFTITLALALAPFYLLRDERQRTAFIYSLALVSVAVTVLALLNPSTSADYTNRLTLDGADTIGTARVSMAGAVILSLLAFQRGNRPALRFGMIGLAGVTAMLGVMSGSRGPVIAGVVAVLVAIALAPSMRAYRGRALLGALALGGIVVSIALQNQSDGLNRIMSALLGDSDTSSSIRSELLKTGFDQLARDPLGTGWGGYADDSSPYRYPHNLFVEIGIEAGWFVLIIFGTLVALTLIRGLQVATTGVNTIIFSLFIFSLINVLVSADINGTRLFWPMLFAIWVIRKSPSEPWFYSRTAHRKHEISVSTPLFVFGSLPPVP